MFWLVCLLSNRVIVVGFIVFKIVVVLVFGSLKENVQFVLFVLFCFRELLGKEIFVLV